jgi:hypothetical protein
MPRRTKEITARTVYKKRAESKCSNIHDSATLDKA